MNISEENNDIIPKSATGDSVHSEMGKDLFLILKTQYFKEIEAGTKTSEYRLLTDYWLTRLTSHDWRYVTFQLGYRKDAPRIRKRIISIEITTIEHEFFGGNPVEVLEIKLG